MKLTLLVAANKAAWVDMILLEAFEAWLPYTASQPFCQWLKYEHRSVLISQAGCMDVVKVHIPTPTPTVQPMAGTCAADVGILNCIAFFLE